MKEETENKIKLKAYYKVVESFNTSDDDEQCITREVFFKNGSLLEMRSDALDYCANRSNEFSIRVNGDEPPSVEEEKAEYRDLNIGWAPLPGADEVTYDWDRFELSCSLILEQNNSVDETVILHNRPELFDALFFFIALGIEADFLRDNM